MKSMYSLVELVVVLGALGTSCKATVEGESGGARVGGSLEITRAQGPAGSCMTLVFLDEEGNEIDRASGGVPFEVPTPPGTARVRMEPCPPSQMIASLGRAPRRSPLSFISIPCRLQDRLRFLAGTARAFSRDEAERLISGREQAWTTTPSSPLVTVDAMMEVEAAGADLLIHVVAQGQIQSLDLDWNGSAYASLDDATVTEVNGWHTATFLIHAADIEVPSSSSVENSLHYEMDTLERTGLSFDASIRLDP